MEIDHKHPVGAQSPKGREGETSRGEVAYDIFIAYATPDREQAQSIFGALTAVGYRVFMDVACLELGDSWDLVIPRAQRRSRCTLILISQHTNAAFYQRAEVAEAIALARRQDATHRVIPVCLEGEGTSGSEEIPYGLQVLQGCKLRHGEGYRELLEGLARVLPSHTIQVPRPETRAWCWRGTAGTVEHGTISILALVETFLATAAYAWIALHYGTFHLMLSACVAPLLLLRTPVSQTLGLRYGLRTLSWLATKFQRVLREPRSKRVPKNKGDGAAQEKYAWWVYALTFIAVSIAAVPFILFALFVIGGMLAVFGLSMLCTRFGATVTAFCSVPADSVKAIPFNWWRNIACVDSTLMPEPLPGIDTAVGRPEFAAFSGVIEAAHPSIGLKKLLRLVKENKGVVKLVVVGTIVSFVFFVVLPAILYRWALKGTFLVYSPLVWIAHRSFSVELKDWLLDIREVAFHRLVRGYSSLVMAALLVKVILDALFSRWSTLWAAFPSAPIISGVIAPGRWPLWQMAMGFNAMTAWVFYYVADWALVRQKRGRALNEKRVDFFIRSLWVVRAILTVLVIGNAIYAAARFAGVFPL